MKRKKKTVVTVPAQTKPKRKYEKKSGPKAKPTQGTFDPLGELRLTDKELLRFNNLRLQQENKLQAIRVLHLEQAQADRDYADQRQTRRTLIKQHEEELKPVEAEYKDCVCSMAEKYGLDPRKMGIDDMSGILRDLRDET